MFERPKSPPDEKNTQPISEADYILSPHNLFYYQPAEINKILQKWALQKNEHHLTTINTLADPTKPSKTIAWILQNQQSERIALFKIATIQSINQNTKIEDSLEHFLACYDDKNLPCDKLIIPIEDLDRNQYRLLTIVPSKKTVFFYDSKARITGQVEEFYTSLKATYYSDKQSYCDIPYIFMEKYYHVESTCKKYFSGFAFKEIFLGHQEANSHTDYTPLVVEYATSEALNRNLADISISSLQKMRTKHSDLFYGNTAKPSFMKNPKHLLFSQTLADQPATPEGPKYKL